MLHSSMTADFLPGMLLFHVLILHNNQGRGKNGICLVNAWFTSVSDEDAFAEGHCWTHHLRFVQGLNCTMGPSFST